MHGFERRQRPAERGKGQDRAFDSKGSRIVRPNDNGSSMRLPLGRPAALSTGSILSWWCLHRRRTNWISLFAASEWVWSAQNREISSHGQQIVSLLLVVADIPNIPRIILVASGYEQELEAAQLQAQIEVEACS